MSGQAGKKKINRKRLILSFAPVLILLTAIIVLNVRMRRTPQPQPTVVPTAVPTQAIAAGSTPTRPPILQATVLPSPTPTATLRPTAAASATISLLGPPAESSTPQDGRLTFYWTYSEPMLPGQEFVFTLRQNDTLLATSSLNRPNLGSGYQIFLDLADLETVGTAVWQVQLQWQDNVTPLVVSESRTLILLP